MAHRVHATLTETSLRDATHWRDGWIPTQMYPDQFKLEISGDQVPQQIPSVVKIWFIIFSC